MKNIIIKLLIYSTLLVSLISCTNPINMYTAKQYMQGGYHSAKQDKWFDARMAFSRARTNVDMGHGPDKLKAVLAYEYGRASGVICDWKESERGLLDALKLDKLTNGPAHMTMVELGRMYNASGNYVSAEKYLKKN